MSTTKKKFPLLLLGVGMMGAAIYMMDRYSKQGEAKKAAEGFAKLDTSTMTPEQVWNAALKLNKERRIADGKKIVELEMLCHFTEDTLRVANGIKAFATTTKNHDVPDFVKLVLGQLWAIEFMTVHKFEARDLELVHKDFKFVEEHDVNPHPDDAAWRWGMAMAQSMKNWDKNRALERVRTPVRRT